MTMHVDMLVQQKKLLLIPLLNETLQAMNGHQERGPQMPLGTNSYIGFLIQSGKSFQS